MKSINDIIKDYFYENGIKQNSIADKLGIKSYSSFSQMLKNNSLNSELIYKISLACNYDFFAELSKEMRKEHKEIKSSLNKETNTSEFEDAMIEVLKKRFPNIFK